jgi:hypothetical protein
MVEWQYGRFITKYYLWRKSDEKRKEPYCFGHVAGNGV